MFPKNYSKYDGLVCSRSSDGDCYVHCEKIEGCELELVSEFSEIGSGAVMIEYYSPIYGAYIDFLVDDLKITIEYYMEDVGGEYNFIYDIKVYDENNILIGEYNVLDMTKTKLKIEWYSGTKLKIYLYNDFEYGEILDLNVNYTVGKWRMNIKGVVEIYNLSVYRRWI